MNLKTDFTYFQQLDSLRFFAFLAVLVSHVFQPDVLGEATGVISEITFELSKIGFLGIDFFFVLSAFLISYKFFEETDKTGGNFKLGYFLIRRILRIWPLYFLMVLLGGLAIIINNHYNNGISEMPPIHYFLLFIINFYIADHGNFFLFFLVFLWSITVEEQFYIIWGLSFKFLRKYFTILCFALIMLSLTFRYFYLEDNAQLYYNTLSLAADFGVGSLLGYLCFFKTEVFQKLKVLPGWTIIGFYLVFILMIIFYKMLFVPNVMIIVERLIFSLTFSFIIFEQLFAVNSFFKTGKKRSISYLGKISYGLYCYHGIVITLFLFINKSFSFVGSFFTLPLLIFLVTVGISILSYEFFEKRFLVLKTAFYPSF